MTLPHGPRPRLPAASDPRALPAARLRAVHRAATDLRRGIPVRLEGPGLLIAAAETVGPAGLAEFLSAAAGPAALLLAPTRAAAVLRRPMAGAAVALELPPALLTPEALARLADPTLDQALPAAPAARESAPAGAEAALALAKLARLLPAVLAAPPGETPAGETPAGAILSVPAADVLAYRPAAALSLRRLTEAQVPLSAAPDARIVIFRPADGGTEHLAILVGDPAAEPAPLVRLHSECFTGDLLDSLRCDCGAQLRGAIARMAEAGAGVLLYLAQEGRGIGLASKLRAYTLQDRGLDTLDANRALGWEADERNFLLAAMMLESLGIRRVRLLTNNPDKLSGLTACGIEIAGREPHAFAPNGINDEYLATKARRFGHLLD
ncbi:MAG: GTP cyclohydrolase II [Acetobacteraceae bacterium]